MTVSKTRIARGKAALVRIPMPDRLEFLSCHDATREGGIFYIGDGGIVARWARGFAPTPDNLSLVLQHLIRPNSANLDRPITAQQVKDLLSNPPEPEPGVMLVSVQNGEGIIGRAKCLDPIAAGIAAMLIIAEAGELFAGDTIAIGEVDNDDPALADFEQPGRAA